MSGTDAPAYRPLATESSWVPLFRLAAATAVVVVCLIPLQALVFLLSPPPQTVGGYFDLFQRNPFLGLVDLDLLLIVDYLAMIPLYLSLYVLVRRRSHTLAALGVVFGLFSLLLFLVSREATFSMWMLSSQHALATTDAQRAALDASGQVLLTLYNGGTFGLSYVPGAASTMLFSVALWRYQIVGKAVGIVGVVTALTMLVPPNVGPVGLVVAMLSLIPTAVWLILLARRLRHVTG
jgi:Domain of unknown function (DUF4386)